ncbi:MAG: hypothetical protein L3J52_02290 [Proteobacteria bacterium]|nr:hypothetical protein [Pseudomonadota bacterium]
MVRLRYIWLILLAFSDSNAEIELNIVGGKDQLTQFAVLPFEYHGNQLSPAILIEDTLKQTLSSTLLFQTPFSVTPPKDKENLLQWRMQGFRYIIKGIIKDAAVNDMFVDIVIFDSLTVETIYSNIAILNTSHFKLSIQQLADHMYRRMLYTAVINSNIDMETFADDDLTTKYFHQLALTLKTNWQSRSQSGTCTVLVKQLPGGVLMDYVFEKKCYQHIDLVNELIQLFDNIDSFPYKGFQQVFQKDLKVNFSIPR